MTEQTQPMPPPEVNPVTMRRYRRQAWWQITYPVLVVALLAVAAIVLLIVLGGPNAISVVADYALALLIILNVLPVLVLLALAGGLVFAITVLIRRVPPYSYTAQQFVQKIYEWVDRQTDQIASAVITVRSALVGISVFLRQQAEGENQHAAPQPPPGAPEK